MPPGGFEPPPLPPEGSALSPELWGPRGVNNRSRSGGWSWTARVAPWTCRRHGREARCGPATGLPSARCERRDPVRGSVFRAVHQARTTHATSHQMADTAPCERREPARGPVLRAALHARTARATSHRTADAARCVAAIGREARCGPATGLPAARCVRRDPVPGSVFRAALQARTARATSHQMADPAPCERRDPVRGSAFRAALQARTTCATSHRTADAARCVAAAGREARCGPATGLPSARCERRDPVRGSVFRAALHARTARATSHRTADAARCRREGVSPRASPSPTRTAAARPAPHRRRAAPHPAR